MGRWRSTYAHSRTTNSTSSATRWAPSTGASPRPPPSLLLSPVPRGAPVKPCHAMAAATATAILALTSCSPAHVQNPSPSGSGPTTQTAPLEAGQVRSGVLSAADSVGEERRMQTWALRGHRGQQIVVDLISTEFDPLLDVVGPGIHPLSDDDGGGSCNARITFTPPEDGIYWLLVQGSSTAQGGAFTLRAASNALP